MTRIVLRYHCERTLESRPHMGQGQGGEHRYLKRRDNENEIMHKFCCFDYTGSSKDQLKKS